MSRDFFQRIIPADCLELTRTAWAGALDGMGDTIGMVQHLQTRLATGTKLSLVDGMLRIAFELFGQAHFDQALLTTTHHLGFALHYADQQAASRGAYGADARLDGGDAGDQLFVGNEADQLLLRAATAIECGHHSRERRYFDEVASFHRLVVTRLAIDRDLLLRVTVDAKTHIQIDFAFGRCLLGQIAVASG